MQPGMVLAAAGPVVLVLVLVPRLLLDLPLDLLLRDELHLLLVAPRLGQLDAGQLLFPRLLARRHLDRRIDGDPRLFGLLVEARRRGRRDRRRARAVVATAVTVETALR